MRTLTLTALSIAAPLAQAAPVPTAAIADAQLRAVNHAHVQAYIESDQRYFERLVDEDFRFTSAAGEWLDKDAFVALGKDPVRFEAVSYDDVRVRLFGEVALVHGKVIYLKGGESVGMVRYTDAYRWDGSAWRLVSAQLSTVADTAASVLTQRAPPQHAQWAGKAPQGGDEQVLRELNAGYVQAFLDSDVAWYDAHLAPDYLVVFGDGSFHDKSSLLAAAAPPVTAFKSFPTTNVAIRRFGDVALIHAENAFERNDGRKGVNRYTDIWHKRDGRWVCIAAHVTRHKLPS